MWLVKVHMYSGLYCITKLENVVPMSSTRRLITKCILLQWIIFLTGHLRDIVTGLKKSLEIGSYMFVSLYVSLIILRNAVHCKQHLACTTWSCFQVLDTQFTALSSHLTLCYLDIIASRSMHVFFSVNVLFIGSWDTCCVILHSIFVYPRLPFQKPLFTLGIAYLCKLPSGKF